MKNKTNYLFELYQDPKQELLRVMEQEFEKQYPSTKAIFSMDSDNFIRIAIFDRKLRLMNIYHATEFDCVSSYSTDIINPIFKDYPLSDKAIQDSIVRKFYLDFMKKHFESYEKDYTNYISSHHSANEIDHTI